MKIHARHILVNHQYEAEDLLRQLAKGRDFSELAQKHSQCPSRDQGGDLGEVDPRRLDPDFVEAYDALKFNQISKPVRTRFGYHLIQRMK